MAELDDGLFDEAALHAMEVRKLREGLEKMKEAFEAAQAEVERLRAEGAALAAEEDSLSYENGKLRKLCLRAADALESYKLQDFEHNLIDELRKGAE